jgi:hypothetical protein
VTPRVRRGLIAGGLAGLLVVAGMLARDDAPVGTQAPARRSATPAAAPQEVPVADVRLELLEETRPELGEAERNLFRFQARSAPAAPAAPRAPVAAGPRPEPPPVVVPSGPPPPPPISMKFIGLVDAPTQFGRVAMLSDGRGNVFQGKEGDIIEGRYKVLKVGPDIVELAYLDGRGRQTLRLTGQ